MRFMNDYDIERAQQRWAHHPILSAAAQTLANLRDWANNSSDGWPYWRKPAQAAARMMELIERDGTNRYFSDDKREDVTLAEYKAALRPIKAFRTRYHGDFEIVEVAS